MAPVRDRFTRRTAEPALLAPWLLELVRTAPDLVRSYLPGSPIDARTRERVILAVTEVNGDRFCAWIHGAWVDYLGEILDDPEEVELALLAHARACAEAGRPLDTGGLAAALPPGALGAARATIAQVELANLVGNTADGLLARLRGRRPLDPVRAAGEAATVATALPVAVPLLAAGAVMWAVSRMAPPVPRVHAPPEEEANLLVHVLARAVPAYLANAGVRLVVLRLPVPLSIGIRAGRSTATVRIGRGRIAIDNGLGADTAVVLEGDIEPLLHLATGSLLRELATLRLRRD